MVFFKEYKKSDMILAVLSSVIIISTFLILKPGDSSTTFNMISGNAVLGSTGVIITGTIITLAILILIVGFIIGKKHHHKEPEDKKIITKAPLPSFEVKHEVTAKHEENKYDIKVHEEKKEDPVVQKENIVLPEVKKEEVVKVDDVVKSEPPNKPEELIKVRVEQKPSQKSISIDVPYEKQFFLMNGVAIKNISDLNDKIKDMPNDVFSYHVNSDHNHFADWIEGVFDDKSLASRLRGTKTKSEFEAALKA